MTSTLPAAYPETSKERDRWIMDRRPERNTVDPRRPYAFFVEEECSASGEIVPVATVLLTNRECPWRCLMCDLWKNTLTESVRIGAIPAQIDYALALLPSARQIKLYNSGSFFDPRAIPREDYGEIASRVRDFDKVIVECHPSLVAEDCFRFDDLIDGKLEVAMGLETAHPQILEKLNKRMTLQQFAVAADRLQQREIGLRVFILLKPPFMDDEQALDWAKKSLDFAFECQASAATLIPTRSGNGAMDQLALLGNLSPPHLSSLEAAIEYGLTLHQGHVFADLWETRQLKACAHCSKARIDRLHWMNLHQEIPKKIDCALCGCGETNAQ